MLEVVNSGVPWMQLDRAERVEAEKAVETIHPEAGAFAAFTFLDAKLTYCFRDILWQRSLVVKSRAVHMPNQLERTPRKIDQCARTYFSPVRHKLLFGRRHGLRKQLQDVLPRDADMGTHLRFPVSRRQCGCMNLRQLEII